VLNLDWSLSLGFEWEPDLQCCCCGLLYYVCVPTVVDEPCVVVEPRDAEVLRVWAAEAHLVLPEIGAVAKVDCRLHGEGGRWIAGVSISSGDAEFLPLLEFLGLCCMYDGEITIHLNERARLRRQSGCLTGMRVLRSKPPVKGQLCINSITIRSNQLLTCVYFLVLMYS
jgi:hypothetical protein